VAGSPAGFSISPELDQQGYLSAGHLSSDSRVPPAPPDVRAGDSAMRYLLLIEALALKNLQCFAIDDGEPPVTNFDASVLSLKFAL
jgi:hypothetical protein